MTPSSVVLRGHEMLRLTNFRLPSGCRDRQRNSCALQVENLESRQLLDSAGLLWSESPNLTLSFAPDGVDVAGEANQLSFLNEQFAEQDWQAAILRAFQTWAVETNANVGLVAEEAAHGVGHEFGVQGPRTGDERFGDIRIGARPLDDSVLAISVPQDALVSGTWTGDVILNSDGQFASLDELFSVVLHEAGHVFGLDHNTESLSVMREHGIKDATGLLAFDKLLLQSKYGTRQPDDFDLEQANQGTTSSVFGLSTDNSGASPSLLFGDLSANEVDLFEVAVPMGYSGPVVMELQTQGNSLLLPKLEVFQASDADAVLEVTSSDEVGGSTLTLELPHVSDGDQLFARISSDRQDVFSVGGYSLLAVFVDRNEVSPDKIDNLRRFQESLRDTDIDDYFESGEREEFDDDDDDEDDNDDLEFANEIEFEDFEGLRRVSMLGHLDETDEDYYELEVEAVSEGTSALSVIVRSLNPNSAPPAVTFMDEDENELEFDVLIHDTHQMMIQLSEVDDESEFVLRVAVPDDDFTFLDGSYELTVLLTEDAITFAEEVAGELTASQATSQHVLRIEEPQLVHLALNVEDSERDNHLIAMVRDTTTQEVVQTVSAPTGGTRTASTRLMFPGTYTIDVSARSAVLADAGYSVLASIGSGPFGLIPVKPSGLDFHCPGIDNGFCYPGGIHSEAPLLWDEFLQDLGNIENPPNIEGLGSQEQIDLLLEPWWQWYWQRFPTDNSPPLAKNDAFVVTPDSVFEVSRSEGVLSNDIDLDGDVLSASLAARPTQGQLNFQSDGSFQFTPRNGFVGVDSFSYVVTDGVNVPKTGIITLDVRLVGDISGDGTVGANDIDDLSAAIRDGRTEQRFDVDGNGQVNRADHQYLVQQVVGSNFGDANLDGTFNSADLILIFQAGLFEDPSATATWSTGDWDGDGRFDSGDLVVAFQAGAYAP